MWVVEIVMEAPSPAGQALTLAREAKGWTQRELANASGVSQAVLSKAESGISDLGSRLPSVATALGCPAEVLRVGLPVSGAPVTCLHHRRRASQVNAKAQKRVQALAQLTRVTVTGLMDAAGAAPQVEPGSVAFGELVPADERHPIIIGSAGPRGPRQPRRVLVGLLFGSQR